MSEAGTDKDSASLIPAAAKTFLTRNVLDPIKSHPFRTAAICLGAVLLITAVTLAVTLMDPNAKVETVTEPPVVVIDEIWEDPKQMSLLLLVGGATKEPVGHAEVVDISGHSRGCNWAVPLPNPNIAHAAGARYLGHPVVCGGRGPEDDSAILNECWMLVNGNWTLLGKMNTPRSDHAAVNIHRDKFWMTGGGSDLSYLSTTEIFNGEYFEPGPTLPIIVLDHCIFKLNSSHYGLLGGRAFLDNKWQESNRFFLFDSKNHTWNLGLPNMRIPRRELACGIIKHPDRGLELLAAGGYNDINGTSEIFNFRTMTWSKGPPFPKPVRNPESVPYQDTLLVVNGWRWLDDTLTHTIQKYNLEEDAWEQIWEHSQFAKNGQVAMMVSNQTTPCSGHGHIFGQEK